ncbi:MAG: hypothetical protein AAGG75_07970 [Bacteroidota bacterium]
MNGNDFKEFFTQLFTALSVKDSILILLFLLISFLLGWLFRSFSARAKVRKLKRQLAEKEKTLIATEANYTALSEQFKLREDEIKKLEQELDELKVGHEALHRQKEQMGLELDKARTEINQLGAYQSELVNANLQIEQLNTTQVERQTEFDALQLALTAAQTQVSSAETGGTEKQQRIDELETQAEALRAQIAELEAAAAQAPAASDEVEELNLGALDDITEIQNNYANTVSRLAAIEQKLVALEGENAGLKEKIAGIQPLSVVKETLAEEEEEDVEEKAAKARKAINEVLGGRIKKALATDRDDLKKINGIGPFIEEKLNEIGIYTFEQITQFDDEFIEQVTAAIQFFPGRIKRDDWVGQAQKLMA